LDRWFWELAFADKALAANSSIDCWVDTALVQAAPAVIPRLLILAVALKWLPVVALAQPVALKSLLLLAILVQAVLFRAAVLKPLVLRSLAAHRSWTSSRV
jgi:hypothetical protein